MNRSKRTAVLAVVAMLSVLSPAHAADLLVSSALNNQVLRYRGNTGVFHSAFVPTGANGLSAPAGLAFSRDGDFHVAGGDDNAVLRYDGVTGASIDVFATAEMHGPAGIAVGRDGHLYVSSRLDDRVLRYHGTTGAFMDAFVEDCGVAHPLEHIFVAPVDGDFRLIAGSPAIGAGAGSLFQGGTERVPTADFEGDPRAEGLPAIGFDERP